MSGILVTGGSGQVASAVAVLGAFWGLPVRLVGRPAFDFDQPESIHAVFQSVAPAIVVNAAAYTAVDQAEADADAAWRANHAGPARLAELCAQSGTRLLHISTDYVFAGAKPTPYLEGDMTGPTGVYGASKLAGERAVMATLPSAVVLRTAWVYAARGKNFLLTMLNAARKTTTLKVVGDQMGCPTLAVDLAAAILGIVTAPRWIGGIYHAAGGGEASWHGFAEAIFDRAALHGLPRPQVSAIATADWPTPAQRPANSRLDCALLRQTYGIALPPWQHSMARTVDAVMTREPAVPAG